MRRLTLALTLFGVLSMTGGMLLIQAAIYVGNLPDARAGVSWTILLILIPTVITGILSGLAAAFGAYVGARMSADAPGPAVNNAARSVGAGMGGAVGSTVFLIYLSWFYQNGPGVFIGILGFVVIFGAYAGFAALWGAARGLPRSRRTGGSAETDG
ncbi:hypothetical protein [Microbacterium sp. cx-59]|uniref:hypothetical protein n=1 Tax=Microbacterium sp. cx-59 TaxID=2891207 RepID=UPI001E621838|nr:hypothetical protein [Microbacterium sp. cx-59]MCC4909218.1 hypothetical protein [Microbacterium sp. cx-59]